VGFTQTRFLCSFSICFWERGLYPESSESTSSCLLWRFHFPFFLASDCQISFSMSLFIVPSYVSSVSSHAFMDTEQRTLTVVFVLFSSDSVHPFVCDLLVQVLIILLEGHATHRPNHSDFHPNCSWYLLFIIIKNAEIHLYMFVFRYWFWTVFQLFSIWCNTDCEVGPVGSL